MQIKWHAIRSSSLWLNMSIHAWLLNYASELKATLIHINTTSIYPDHNIRMVRYKGKRGRKTENERIPFVEMAVI